MSMKSYVLAASLAVASATGAQAALLDLPTSAEVVVTDTGLGSAYYGSDPFFDEGDFFYDSTAGAVSGVVAGLPVSDWTITIFDNVIGGFLLGVQISVLDGANGSALTGDLITTGVESSSVGPDGADIIELLFDVTGGSAAAAFGDHALFTMVGEFGDDPLGVGFGGFFEPEDVTATLAAVVPLPAPLLMLGSALFGLCAMRRQQSAAKSA